MKKIVFLLIVGLFLSSMAYAGGSIFGKKHKESNEDGVYSIRVFICNTLNCPDVVMHPADCEKVPHSTLQYGVCMCDSGYVMKMVNVLWILPQTATLSAHVIRDIFVTLGVKGPQMFVKR